jgi:hypothetical protein
VPDLLFAVSVAAWVMAGIFFVATFTDDSLSAGNAGTDIARLFSAALVVAGLCGFLIAMLLLRDERGNSEHYVFPIALGAIIGVLEALLFLRPAPGLLFLPFLLLILVFRPFRRMVTGLFGIGRRR